MSLIIETRAATVGTGGDGYRIVWSDEFEYTGLPDPIKWGYENNYVRNNEPQLYTTGRNENARVENGFLIIEARKESRSGVNYLVYDPAGKLLPYHGYTSASLYSLHKPGWTFGRIEVRAKLPAARGLWPAVWTVGADKAVAWPRCGEIDIMEYFGAGEQTVGSAIHYESKGTHAVIGKQCEVPALTEDFHVFRADWTADHIAFYVDGNLTHTIELPLANCDFTPFRMPHYLLLNLAIHPPERPPYSHVAPSFTSAQFVIDYVRIYQREKESQ